MPALASSRHSSSSSSSSSSTLQQHPAATTTVLIEDNTDMTPIEEIPGGVKNKAVLQNAAAAKRILRGSVWSQDIGEDQKAADSDLEEEEPVTPEAFQS